MKKKLMTVISLIVIVASGIVGYKFFVESDSSEEPKTDTGTAIQRVSLGNFQIAMDAEY